MEKIDVNTKSGLVLVADIDYFPAGASSVPVLQYGEILQLPKGQYKVQWKIDDTIAGEICCEDKLEISGGMVVIIDPQYVVENQQLQKWLDGEKLKHDKAFLIPSFGKKTLHLQFMQKQARAA